MAGRRQPIGYPRGLADGRHERAVEELRRAHEGARECVLCWLPQLGRAYDGAGAADSAIAVWKARRRLQTLARREG